jgi:4,5-dihydroxyphthalate decarboxylase
MDKTIEPAGITLDFQPEMTNPVRHKAMVADLAFDVCELNVSTYLIARDQGVPITAIPVFLFRKFRHGNIFVNPASGITTPGQLAGKRIGVPSLQPASNVWIHGILQDAGELAHDAVTWVLEREEDVGFTAPPGLRIERAPKGSSIVDLLMAGAVDAVTMPQTPKPLIDGDPRIARLFPDYVAREQQYFRDTGLFPIMHVTALPTALVAREPWIVESLIAAFEAAKQAANHHFSNVRVGTLAWFGAHWEEEHAMFGNDAWPYGLGDTNRRNLETVIRYTHEQGLTRRRQSLEELFTVA